VSVRIDDILCVYTGMVANGLSVGAIPVLFFTRRIKTSLPTSMRSGIGQRRSFGLSPFVWKGVVASGGWSSDVSKLWLRKTLIHSWVRGMNTSGSELREVLVQSVRVSDEAVFADLADGRTVTVPLAWFPRLAHGTPEERSHWRVTGGGEGIHWPDLDEDVSVESLLAGRRSRETQESLRRWLERRRSSPMPPPEVILDRWIKERGSRHESGFSGYLGTLDIERVETLSFRSFLYLIRNAMNEALLLEGPNASGGMEHPPFHFDFVDVEHGIENAHAFQHAGLSFIAVTLPMVELIWNVSHRLSRSRLVLERLSLGPEVNRDAFQGLLFQMQMNFLVSHEYTHHIHGHVPGPNRGEAEVWSEFSNHTTSGNLQSQAEELDADGYAEFLVLAHLLRGERRNTALAQCGRAELQGVDGDKLLLTCLFLSLLAFFCSFWRGATATASIYDLQHPPPPVRFTYAIRVAEMWCGQNKSVPQAWFNAAQFQELFRAAAETVGGTAREAWDTQMAFLHSADGAEYDRRLGERFESMRRKPNGFV
jgi:Protein of unknown function (DUF2442)